jgi:four helix bundle protein
MSVQSYRDLAAWQKAMDVVETVYRATQQWPREEVYGLTNQARRAAVTVPANIAEGQGRRGPTEMLHHLSIADGSLHEWRPICSSRSACATWTAQPRRSCSRRLRRSDASWVVSCAACASQATDDRCQTRRSMPFAPPPPVLCRLPPVACRLLE